MAPTQGASSAPPVVIDDPAGQHHPIRLEALTGHHQAELVEASEGRQISTIEGSVKHVEVSRMGSVRTSIGSAARIGDSG
jgi:hypothetical protein